jgi:hypothetical protein
MRFAAGERDRIKGQLWRDGNKNLRRFVYAVRIHGNHKKGEGIILPATKSLLLLD